MNPFKTEKFFWKTNNLAPLPFFFFFFHSLLGLRDQKEGSAEEREQTSGTRDNFIIGYISKTKRFSIPKNFWSTLLGTIRDLEAISEMVPALQEFNVVGETKLIYINLCKTVQFFKNMPH